MPSLDAQLARCDAEIAEALRLLRAGQPREDLLLLWLRDWRRNKKMILEERDAEDRTNR